jgi:hypothetical protein
MIERQGVKLQTPFKAEPLEVSYRFYPADGTSTAWVNIIGIIGLDKEPTLEIFSALRGLVMAYEAAR